MAINLSGLNGRNVMFWKWCIPVKAYIVKYTKEGKYYALSKRNGKLYEFSQYTGVDTDGAKGEEVRVKRVPYSILEKYNIMINPDNWMSFIDYNHKNIRWDKNDTLDLIRDILRIGSVITMILGIIVFRILFAFDITFNFGFIGIPSSIMLALSLFIGRFPSSLDNARRARKSEE